jgi:hypothetical protein
MGEGIAMGNRKYGSNVNEYTEKIILPSPTQ